MRKKEKEEYGRIYVLETSLEQAGIDSQISAQIMEGSETIRQSSTPKKKADWFRGAMERMDVLMEPEIRHAVRENCACCLGGKREQLSKAIARDHDTLEARVAAANETPFVFGHSVKLREDGKVQVAFAPEGEASYRCVCLSKAEEPISITYCYCCGGHVKHHLQNALGCPVHVDVLSSPLSSGGRKPCTFLFTLAD